MRRPLVLVLLVPLLAACGSSGSSTQAKKRPAGGKQAAGLTPTGCRRVAPAKPRPAPHLEAPTQRLDPAKDWRATIRTNCGTIVIALDAKGSPKTASSFAFLARRGFYDGLAFHRVAQGFVIQGGDPNGDGTGGPGYETVEPPPRSTRYTRGVVAMAKAQTEPRGAAGSQFFIVTAEDASASAGLTPDYALLGKVLGGMGAVGRINAIPTDPPGDGQPQDPVVMSSVTVSGR